MWHEGVEGAEGCGGLRGEDVAAAVRMGCVIVYVERRGESATVNPLVHPML